jgi:hypothetical protein
MKSRTAVKLPPKTLAFDVRLYTWHMYQILGGSGQMWPIADRNIWTFSTEIAFCILHRLNVAAVDRSTFRLSHCMWADEAGRHSPK